MQNNGGCSLMIHHTPKRKHHFLILGSETFRLHSHFAIWNHRLKHHASTCDSKWREDGCAMCIWVPLSLTPQTQCGSALIVAWQDHAALSLSPQKGAGASFRATKMRRAVLALCDTNLHANRSKKLHRGNAHYRYAMMWIVPYIYFFLSPWYNAKQQWQCEKTVRMALSCPLMDQKSARRVKFRSIYGSSHLREVNPMTDFCRNGLLKKKNVISWLQPLTNVFWQQRSPAVRIQ